MLEQNVCAEWWLHATYSKNKKKEESTVIPLLLQAPLPLLWSLPHFVATLRVCSSFYVIAPRLDIKHPRHPVFTANSVQHLPTGVFEVVKLEPIVVDCGVNRKKKKNYNQLMCQLTLCIIQYISSSQTFGGMHFNSSISFRIFFHPYSFNKSRYNNAAGSSQRPAVSL